MVPRVSRYIFIVQNFNILVNWLQPIARMVHAADLVRAELGLADQEWIAQAGYDPRGQDWWDQWFRD